MAGYKKHEKLVIIPLVLALAIIIMLGPANGDMSICGVPTEGLKSCKASVSKPNPVPPTDACCSAIANADFQCLCRFKDSPLLKSFGVNPDLAMQLPTKCNLGQSVTCQ